MIETTTAPDLAAWYGMTPQGVLKRLHKAGLQPVSRGAHGVFRWERISALQVMDDTPGE